MSMQGENGTGSFEGQVSDGATTQPQSTVKVGDIVWQTKHAPDGHRYRVLEHRGVTVLGQPVDPDTNRAVRGAEPVELNAATISRAEDGKRAAREKR